MKIKNILHSIIYQLIFMVLSVKPVFASGFGDIYFDPFGDSAQKEKDLGNTYGNISSTWGSVVTWMQVIVFVILFIFLIRAAYSFMTSRGLPYKREAALQRLLTVIVAMALIGGLSLLINLGLGLFN